MSFFKSQVSFTYILHHLSVSWHIIYLDFSSWGITLWTKRAHESTNFQIFDCFNESSPNSSCQFWNHSVKVYSNFASMFSVMKDNSSVFFYLKPLYFWQKEPFKVKFSNFWVVGWKLPNSLCQVWNYTSVFFLILHHSLVLWEITLLYFLAETAHDLEKRSPSKCKISDLQLLT